LEALKWVRVTVFKKKKKVQSDSAVLGLQISGIAYWENSCVIADNLPNTKGIVFPKYKKYTECKFQSILSTSALQPVDLTFSCLQWSGTAPSLVRKVTVFFL